MELVLFAFHIAFAYSIPIRYCQSGSSQVCENFAFDFDGWKISPWALNATELPNILQLPEERSFLLKFVLYLHIFVEYKIA